MKYLKLYFFIFSLIFLEINSISFSESLEIVAKWNIVQFDMGNNEIVNCTNCLPAGIKLSKNGTIFVSFPRWFDDVIVTFARYNKTTNYFEPWPNRGANEKYKTKDPSGLNSILGFEIDENDNIYLLDQGKINNQPAEINTTKVLKYSIEGYLLKTYIINSTIADPYSSFLNDIVIDKNKNYAYISDSGIPIDPEKYEYKPGIIAINLRNSSMNRILDSHESVYPEESFWLHINKKPVNENSPMRTGVDGLALSCDGLSLYYCPLTGRMVYSVSVEEIHKSISSNGNYNITVYQGFKKEASDGMIASSKGNLYMSGIESGSIFVASEVEQDLLRFDYKDFNKFEGSSLTMWPDTLALHEGFLYFVTNQLNNFPQGINYTNPENGEYNFAILRFDVGNDDSYIKGCSGFGNNWGIGSIIIWICFAVIILIVLSFVLMGSNNQEEVIDKHMNLGVRED